MAAKVFRTGLIVAAAAFTLVLAAYTVADDGIKSDSAQAKRAFEYLKKVRKDPNSYTERLHVSLKDVAAGPDLTWNDTLASVATAKAMDMAQQGYYAHTDKNGYGINYYINKAGYKLADEYLKHKGASDFEAFVGGQQSGENAIGYMITDKDESSLASRKLLLAMTDFSKGLKDIGIGFVLGTKDTKYRFYIVVIIAKRK